MEEPNIPGKSIRAFGSGKSGLNVEGKIHEIA